MASDNARLYPGTELHVFASARCWKEYWSRYVRQFIGPKVLEVGAGIGASTVLLCEASVKRWCAQARSSPGGRAESIAGARIA
jgi:hypothetical protein